MQIDMQNPLKRRKMRLNGEWSLHAGNRVYELITCKHVCYQKKSVDNDDFHKIIF
jgi:hypothetical protein